MRALRPLLCGLIEQGETSSGALISFVYVEEDLEVLSSAARELVRLYEADDGDDLGGARFVRQLIDEAEDDLQRVGLVRGLLLRSAEGAERAFVQAAEDHGGGVRLADIRGRFGGRVEAIVRDCSDALPGVGEPKKPWKEHKDDYLRHLQDIDEGVLLVSPADKLHNARAVLLDYREVDEAVWKRFKGGREETLWNYRAGRGLRPAASGTNDP